MKRVLSADFFELRKLKSTVILPAAALALGVFLPMLFYGMVVLFRQISEMPGLDQESVMSMRMMMNSFDARTVFFSCLPLSQGFGIVLTAMLGFRAVRPFGTGIYRNKVIAKVPRGAIYVSQSIVCMLLASVSAAIYTIVTAFVTRLTFGSMDLSSREILIIILLSFGIYLVYTAITVFIAFMTRSVPLTIIIAILLPVLAQTVVPLAASAIGNVSDILKNLAAILPSVQSTYLSNANTPNSVLCIAIASDIVLTALLTLLGILRFRQTDLN